MRPLSAALLLAFLAPLSAWAQLRATLAFELAAQTGIIEGIACRASTGEYFFGDVRLRCVWHRDNAGNLDRFSPPSDALFGVFNVAIDEPRHLLWAATTMVPQTFGYTSDDADNASLVAFDLTDGHIVDNYAVPADNRHHLFGDLLLAPDGTVYVTDSLAPVVWCLRPNSSELASFVESSSFHSLQGLAFVAGGKKLLVSDNVRGLFTIDLATRAVRPVTAPADADLRGLDGLLADGGAIFAVQNGANPQRVLRLTLAPGAGSVTQVDPVSAPPDFGDLTLLTLVAGHPEVVASSGWAHATDSSSEMPPHTVRVYSLTTGAP